MSRAFNDNYIPNNVVFNHGILPQTVADLSTFDLSESLSTTMNFDVLVPVYWEELNPNDHLEVSIKSLSRLAPMVAPIMSNIKLNYFAFFVPNRLLWEHWEEFCGARVNQKSTAERVLPQVALTEVNSGSIADYLGLPPGNYNGTKKVSALPFRAYNMIWNKWFRSNQLQEEVKEFIGDDDTLVDEFRLLRCGKPLDYFTSCLPYPQVTEPVTIPLTGNAPVMTNPGTQTVVNMYSDYSKKSMATVLSTSGTTSSNVVTGSYWQDGSVSHDTNLFADMSNVTGVSIAALRQASAMQVLLERDARAGETYIDIMTSHYGVTIPDFLVGRPQYLGSTSSYINAEPVAQTGETGNTPQGTLASVGFGMENEKLCEISAVEHGIFMIFACASGDQAYQQGIDRKWNKSTRFKYMFPEFWNIGDQAVENQEIYYDFKNPENNEKVFGYAERYAEYRAGKNRVSGLMRTNLHNPVRPGSLDFWHLYQSYSTLPVLGDEFIKLNTPITRVLADTEQDHLFMNIWFDIKATRNLPIVSNPSLKVGGI